MLFSRACSTRLKWLSCQAKMPETFYLFHTQGMHTKSIPRNCWDQEAPGCKIAVFKQNYSKPGSLPPGQCSRQGVMHQCMFILTGLGGYLNVCYVPTRGNSHVHICTQSPCTSGGDVSQGREKKEGLLFIRRSHLGEQQACFVQKPVYHQQINWKKRAKHYFFKYESMFSCPVAQNNMSNR